MQQCDPHVVHAFFCSRLGLHFSDDFRGVLYVPDEYLGRIANMDHVAVAWAFNGFIGKTCCVHSVVQKPELLTRKMLREGFTYAFEACHVEALLGLVDSTNKAALDFDKRLGFVEIARIAGGGNDGDLVILRMTRAECRWLKRQLH